ncbi:MAG: zinc ABC transporter substrate-binding protein [Erysipelotrichaceae bacterium]|nr:zinc ABC transporter substrate-binding protein [Erysipelotrichaceae bacterium]
MIRSQVAYTVYPVGFLLQRLAGDTITAKSVQSDEIVQRAQLREDYEEILSDSQVFMHIGHLEPYLTVYSSEINQLANEQLDLSTLNAVYDFQRYTQVIADGEITYVESPYYRGEEFQMIDTDIQDLYLWTDPIAMLSMAKDIRDWLIATYPDEKSIYEVNFTRLETDLINLDAQYQALATANEKNDKVIRFVSMTASFGNWQKTYGFQVYPVVLSKYGVLPNARQLELIEERIRTDGVKYIVYEPNMTDDMVSLFNRIEDDLGLRRVELSNLSSLTGSESGKDYLSIMYENLNALETMTEDRTASEETTAVEADAAEALTTEESSEETTD